MKVKFDWIGTRVVALILFVTLLIPVIPSYAAPDYSASVRRKRG